MVDRKGVFSFLAITFGLTYLVEGLLIASGFRVGGRPPIFGQAVIAAVMWVPALATVLTIRLVTREGFAITNLRFGSWRPYLTTALVIPAAFAVIYGMTWLLGLGSPDWGLIQFRSQMQAMGADPSQMPPASQFLPLMLLATLFLTPFINGLFGFGEELGWRGYLLPKLMPLGKTKAYLLLGAIWGLWHAPLILVGFNYPGYPLLGVLWMIGMVTALGIYMNEMTLRHRSSILAGWMHGLFNSQAYGIWRVLFPEVNPLWGGVTGLLGMLVWLGLGVWQMRRGGEG
jgi:hypothetical protein